MNEQAAAGSEEFAGRLLEILNDGALALMISIGHRTGLFDTMAKLPPGTSEKIADTSGLNERYVREWLAAMTVGGIVDHNPTEMTFLLPPERAAWLIRSSGPDNLAIQAQYIGLMALVEDQIIDCFKQGGGVPYSQFPKFQVLMAEESAAVHNSSLLEVILPLADGLVDGLNAGIDVADVGCGSGHAVNLMAEAFPSSRFLGLDFSEGGIAAGTAEAESKGLSNVAFRKQDAATIDGSEKFDLITTFDAVHDQARPDLVLSAIANSLRPGGTYLCVDIAASSTLNENRDHPLGAFLYTISCMHCMTVSLADAGMGLGTVWGEQKALEMLGQAGFSSVTVKQVEGDIINNYYIATRS